MNSRVTLRFRELFAALPERVKRQSRESYRLFRESPSHPGLHFKQVCVEPKTYSARIGIGYRALGVFDGNTIVWFWIGTHAEYNKLLK
jgi:hypothetical protein